MAKKHEVDLVAMQERVENEIPPSLERMLLIMALEYASGGDTSTSLTLEDYLDERKDFTPMSHPFSLVKDHLTELVVAAREASERLSKALVPFEEVSRG